MKGQTREEDSEQEGEEVRQGLSVELARSCRATRHTHTHTHTPSPTSLPASLSFPQGGRQRTKENKRPDKERDTDTYTQTQTQIPPEHNSFIRKEKEKKDQNL